MAVTIQVKRGSNANTPSLASGEFGLATDTNELYIGGESGNLQIAMLDRNGKIPSNTLNADTAPASGSANPITSGGVYTLITTSVYGDLNNVASADTVYTTARIRNSSLNTTAATVNITQNGDIAWVYE